MAEPKENVLMEKIVSLCKRRGFIYQSSEIYGGINGFWDYGPLGAELKRNVKELWWREMVQWRDDVVGLEATIIMHPQIWRASGHVDTFADLMRACPATKKLVRADQVEPQSGIVYHYKGAFSGTLFRLATVAGITGGKGVPAEVDQKFFEDERVHRLASSMLNHPDENTRRDAKRIIDRIEKEFRCDESISILVPPGKPKETAEKVAKQFYASCGISDPLLNEAGSEKVENSTDFHPESGVRLTEARPFNLMLQTWVGPIQSDENIAYLRPETAQAIFAQFKTVLETSRQKVPFGIAQVGKAFRNEITPRNFTFRSREFEQMELEFFIRPDEAIEAMQGSVARVPEQGHPGEPQPNWGWQAWHRYWVEERVRFYEGLGLSRSTLGFHVQTPEELAHYARATVDILYKFPFSKEEDGVVKGDELEGIAARGAFDLTQHEKFSGKPLAVFDEDVRGAWTKLPEEKRGQMREAFIQEKTRVNIEKKKMEPGEAGEAARKEAGEFFDRLSKGQFIPHVIEPSAGVDRLILALICNAFAEMHDPDEKGKSDTRVVMRFHPRVAPIKVAVLPLLKNKPDLVAKAHSIFTDLRRHMATFYDDAGSIGRRYARQDEAGTPFCVTVDFETLEGMKEGPLAGQKDTVTVRYRGNTDEENGKQERIPISQLREWLLERIR
jgi:glycyl-tRNA synthetase